MSAIAIETMLRLKDLFYKEDDNGVRRPKKGTQVMKWAMGITFIAGVLHTKLDKTEKSIDMITQELIATRIEVAVLKNQVGDLKTDTGFVRRGIERLLRNQRHAEGRPN